MKNKSLQLRSLILTALIVAALFSWGMPVVQAQQSSALAQTFQTDNSKGKVVPGALVNLKSGNGRSVELTTLGTSDQLIGIVDENPLVSISGKDQETQVVLSGTTRVLASDINGVITAGDKITASPIAGVGMRATAESTVVGTAQGSFEATDTKEIADKSGKKHPIHLGYVEVQVGVAYFQAAGSDFLPPFIQGLANSLAGRPVSLMRVLISSILLILGFTSVIILVYTSVRSAMTSIGRNPLAAGAIRKGLLQVGTVALVVVVGTLFASYLVLRV